MRRKALLLIGVAGAAVLVGAPVCLAGRTVGADPAGLRAVVEAAVVEERLGPRLAVALLAHAGHRTTQVAIGQTMLRVNPEHPEEGRQWLERAARQGDARAAYALALSLRSEGGRAREAALPWLEQAATGGVAAAHFLLGNAYREGEGVAVDFARAIRSYEVAAEQENPQAIQTLAEAYRSGELGLARDPERAEALMRDLEHAVHEQRPVVAW